MQKCREREGNKYEPHVFFLYEIIKYARLVKKIASPVTEEKERERETKRKLLSVTIWKIALPKCMLIVIVFFL